jgi:transcription-repair coupling factor (superfamily II helicase)
MKAIEAVLDDLQSGRPMDRLVCGDVGYGKTEVAIRAAFHAVANGKQVAVLVPTTLLATQHESTFKSRLSASAIHVESITRFKSRADQKRVLEETAAGKIDVLIGTHRVLSKDVRFKDLGLVIIDEEQRFGVEHKELLKTLRVNTHVLTLSATPIPRTLHLALSGLRDISLINTPPVDRLPIKTWVSRRNDEMIATAIRNELARGGQVFFLHNRVQTIKETTAQLARTVPEARLGMAHGQMSERDLESAMQAFLKKEKDVLVCTAIIESGLDIPSANTILVDRADHFGLSQLYQIRGRVGRGQVRAYAYLMTPEEAPITEDARKRLDVIQRFIELGSGFSIASHDLEMRGGGDILGPEQSGHIAAVGYELYMELLDEEIRKLRNEGTPLSSDVSSARDPEIKAPYPAFLPEGYVPEVHQRLALYRRLSSARTEGELRDLESEMEDRFGPIGVETKNLLWLIRLKLLLKAHSVDILTVGEGRVVLTAGPGSRFDTDRIIALISSGSGEYQLTPDSRLIARANTKTIHELHFDLERLLEKVARRN